MDKRLFNVVHLGLAFMFVFSAFQTFGNIEQTILDSVKQEDSSFSGSAYISLALIYLFLAVGNWLAPSLIAWGGPRTAMVLGSITYLIFIASFLKPATWSLYLVSIIIGLGASIIWTGQGVYLTQNSDDATISRNSGVFWALLQCSMLFGNFFVYMAFRGKSEIDESSRSLVSWVLSAVCGGGCVLMFLLRPAVSSSGLAHESSTSTSPLQAFLDAFRLLGKREMVLLCVTFFYTGLELTFYSGVYSPSIGFTKNISENPKELVGLSGIFIGVGEITGGLLFGLLGSRTVRWGRDPIVLLGFTVHIITFFCIFLNLPNSAPFSDTTEEAYIHSNSVLAIACSALLGFADSCFNTQIYAAIGTIFSEDSAPAFAIFKFIQSVAAAGAFFYSQYVGLYFQLLILVVSAVLGTVAYCSAERSVRRKAAASQSDRKWIKKERKRRNSDSESVFLSLIQNEESPS